MASCQLHYLAEGPPEGPVAVLSPSLGTDLSMWDPQAALLREHFRVVRYDLRGHGASPVPPGPYSIADLGADLLALLDEIEVARASLCGISIGGMLSLWAAANAPERVERLAVCCTSAMIDPDGAYRTRAELVRARGLEAVADAALARWFTPRFAEREPATIARMRSRLLTIPREGYAGCCEALAEMDLRPVLGSIQSPTLVIAAAEDPSTPPEHGRRIAAGVKAASFEVVSDAAHLANVEQPEIVGELILRHLQAN